MSSGQPPTPSAAGKQTGKHAKRKHSGRELVRLGVVVVLAVLITLFAVLNTGSVQVDWIFGSSSAPLIIVIVISLLVGVVATHLVEWRARKR